MKGYADGTYGPSTVVNRGQMAVFIARAVAGGDSQIPAPPAKADFTDVPTTYWAFKEIEYVYAQHIVVGYGKGIYAPEADVTRDQMAVFITRSIVTPLGDAGLAGYTPPSAATFPDVPTGYWSYQYVEYLHAQGVVVGYSDGTYHPQDAVTRDQMAAFVQRAFGLSV